MNATCLPESIEVAKRRAPMDPWALHAHFLAILPRIETHAKIRFRYLRCPGRRDDAIAEVVAVCWKWFLRLDEQGKDIDEFVMAFADYAVRHVRSGRRLCGQVKSRDVCSPTAQRRHAFEVESLDGCTRRDFGALYADPQGQNYQDAYEDRLKDNTTTPVPDQVMFRIEFPLWLSRLGRRNREIAEDMTLELGTFELADKHKVSPGRISQLRREFHTDWQLFCGDLVAC
jgi:hypothetical protein